MTKKPIPLKNLEGYSVMNGHIIGKKGKVLKPGKHDVYTLLVGGKYIRANLWKLVWCAEHGVDVRQVPRYYSFYGVNGVSVCETFSDRMSRVRKRTSSTVKVTIADYEFIESFARTAKRMMQGDKDAERLLFCMLNSQRDALIAYAEKSCGGVSHQRAVDYTDKAIYQVFDTIVARTRHVPSPIASIKWHINHFIKNGRNNETSRETSALHNY